MAGHIEELVFIIDKSGSMAGLESDTIGGYNSVLERNREGEGTALVTTVFFDTDHVVVHDREDITSVRPLTRDQYRPGGCTALLDAVGDAIERIDLIQRHLPDSCRPTHTTVAIITDGQENASRLHTYPQIEGMIRDHEARGWEFLFLGANIDVAAEAGRMGIPLTNAVAYSADDTGTMAAFDSFSEAVCQARACASIGADWAAPTRADQLRRGRGDGTGRSGARSGNARA